MRPLTALFASAALLSLTLRHVAAGTDPTPAPRVIPRPQIEEVGAGTLALGGKGAEVRAAFKNVDPSESSPCSEGMRLLARRWELLGGGKVVVEKEQGKAEIVIDRCSPDAFAELLRARGVKEEIAGKRLAQAYALDCRPHPGAAGAAVSIKACADLGVYYALVSLCQLLDNDSQGGVCLPVISIVDWPEIGLRLAKASASNNPLPKLKEAAAWAPLYKINLMGLQFHGENSKEPGPFADNVAAICSEARGRGILETIVYFCPFRGNGYDFNNAAHREQYARLLQGFLDQGAHGIEVDYNDWPGMGTPIEDVIKLACKAAAEKDPQAYILYCPPNRGDSVYRSPASPEMGRILSKVPANVWPLWTGMATLIGKPLEPAQVEEWTRAAGRRPFLWVNRVSPTGKGPFAQTVDEVPGALCFRGERLPKELNRLFEGVHFNCALPSKGDPEILAYLATAADFIWNPKGWDAAESCRRAQRFAQIMPPLAEE